MFAYQPNPKFPLVAANQSAPASETGDGVSPAPAMNDPATPVVPPVSTGAPTLSVDPATGPVPTVTDAPLPSDTSASDPPADNDPTDPPPTDDTAEQPPPPTGDKLPPPVVDLDPDDPDSTAVSLVDQGPVSVPSTPPKGIVKFGEYAARWLTLYDLTGHALQSAAGYAPAAWQLNTTEQPDGGVTLTIAYQAIGHATGNQPGGTLHVQQHVVQYLTDDALTFADDTLTYSFGNYAYQHPCMGPLRITGVVTCSGAVTLTAATQQWDGAYACQTGVGGVTVIAVGSPHAIAFQLTKEIGGQTVAPQAFTFSGTYSDNGVAYPFPKGVPASSAWCAAN
ncbi:MAG: hypothetical protein HY696_09440 [Deltaproteobacteria bacterium]|nr:hypothetical protein [Deltaproteobacteria bacterium]